MFALMLRATFPNLISLPTRSPKFLQLPSRYVVIAIRRTIRPTQVAVLRCCLRDGRSIPTLFSGRYLADRRARIAVSRAHWYRCSRAYFRAKGNQRAGHRFAQLGRPVNAGLQPGVAVKGQARSLAPKTRNEHSGNHVSRWTYHGPCAERGRCRGAGPDGKV